MSLATDMEAKSREYKDKALQQLLDELDNEFVKFGEKTNVYIRRGMENSLFEKVFRYTSLVNLLHMLEGGMYVSTRGAFSDHYERGEYNSEELRSIHQSGFQFGERRRQIKELLKEKMSISSSFNVSCWTSKEDSFTMWKAYTYGQIGVCIESTVESLISSISISEGTRIYVSPMEYSKEKNRIKAIDILYSKTENYSDEHEIRVYFLLNDQQEYEKPQPISVKVNPRVLIQSITFSPFLAPQICSLIANQLIAEHDYLAPIINKSEAMEY